MLAPGHRDLVPEPGPQPREGVGLRHGEGDLDPLHQNLRHVTVGKYCYSIATVTCLDILWVGEISGIEDWLGVRIGAPEHYATT